MGLLRALRLALHAQAATEVSPGWKEREAPENPFPLTIALSKGLATPRLPVREQVFKKLNPQDTDGR